MRKNKNKRQADTIMGYWGLYRQILGIIPAV